MTVHAPLALALRELRRALRALCRGEGLAWVAAMHVDCARVYLEAAQGRLVMDRRVHARARVLFVTRIVDWFEAHLARAGYWHAASRPIASNVPGNAEPRA